MEGACSTEFQARTMAENPNSNQVDHVNRATRFPIQTPLRYRQSGELDWHEGVTVNISRTGILFNPDHTIDPETLLEMRILFPVEITGIAPANVVCWGSVVRSVAPTDQNCLPAIAASILHYRFIRD